MRSLAVYLKSYTKESILAPLFKLLEVVFDLLVPIVVARMIDVGIANNDRGYIWGCFGVLLLMAALGLLCSITAQYFAAKASVGFAANLRQAVFDHIQRLSFTELDTLGSDTMITRLTDDINQVQNGVNMGLRLLLRSPFVVFGAMAMAFTIDVKCAWIFVVAIPVLLAVVFAIMLVSIPLFKKVQAGLDRVTGMTRTDLCTQPGDSGDAQRQHRDQPQDDHRGLLDPLADRLYILATLFALTYKDIIPWWFTALLLAREAVMVIVLVVLRLLGHGPPPVHYVGKTATAVLLMGFPLMALARFSDSQEWWSYPSGWALLWWGIVLYWVAAVFYVIQATIHVRAGRLRES